MAKNKSKTATEEPNEQTSQPNPLMDSLTELRAEVDGLLEQLNASTSLVSSQADRIVELENQVARLVTDLETLEGEDGIMPTKTMHPDLDFNLTFQNCLDIAMKFHVVNQSLPYLNGDGMKVCVNEAVAMAERMTFEVAKRTSIKKSNLNDG